MKKAKRLCVGFITVALMLILGFSFAACGDPEPSKDPNDDITPELTAVRLIVDTPPTNTEYYIGESVDLTGIGLKVEWSDGVKGRVDLGDCSVTPAGPLTASDDKITISYAYKSDNVVTADQAITVKDVAVSSIAVDTGNMALKGAVGTPMDLGKIVVTATYADDKTRVVGDYTMKIAKGAEETAVEDPSKVIFESRGDYTVTVSYVGQSASFGVSILNGFIIEAENIIATADITDSDKNFVERYKDSTSGAFSKKENADEPASGGAYMGSVFNGAVMRFHVDVESDTYANIILRASSGYMIKNYNGGWTPLEMGDMQFNRVFGVRYGTAAEVAAEQMRPLYVDDDVVLKGSKTEKPEGDKILWVNWMDVDFGTLSLKQGDNIIELTVISDYLNVLELSCACNIDRLEIEYTDEAPVTVSSLAVKKVPTKTKYYVGDTFDPTGMELEATMSNGSKAAVDPSVCTITPSGALTADDTTVTIGYRGASATQEIETVTVSSLAVKKAPDTTSYNVGEIFDPTGMELTATMGDGSTKDVPASACKITPAGALTVNDTAVTVEYYGKTVTQSITVNADVLTIEGENLIADAAEGDKNYVEAVRNGYQGHPGSKETEAPGIAETSGGKYLNGLFGSSDGTSGAVVRFHIRSDSARKAEIKIYASSCDITVKGTDSQSNWSPSEMGDAQFNRIFAVKFGVADNLAPVTVNDDVIVEGGRTDDGKTSMALWENWRAISLGEFDLAAGDNILELENINSTLKNLAGETYGMNIDKLVVEFKA